MNKDKDNTESYEIHPYKLCIEKEKVKEINMPTEDGWLFYHDL